MLEMPVFEYVGDEYQHGLLEKVAIDWSKQFIRGSLKVKPENNHPNIKKKEQRNVVFFKFSEVGKTLRHLTSGAVDGFAGGHCESCDCPECFSKAVTVKSAAANANR